MCPKAGPIDQQKKVLPLSSRVEPLPLPEFQGPNSVRQWPWVLCPNLGGNSFKVHPGNRSGVACSSAICAHGESLARGFLRLLYKQGNPGKCSWDFRGPIRCALRIPCKEIQGILRPLKPPEHLSGGGWRAQTSLGCSRSLAIKLTDICHRKVVQMYIACYHGYDSGHLWNGKGHGHVFAWASCCLKHFYRDTEVMSIFNHRNKYIFQGFCFVLDFVALM